MNPYIKQQLRMVKIADVPEWDDDTTELTIPRKTAVEITPEIDHYYLIELADYLLNPPDGFSLHDNWNNGNIPKHKYMKCYCTKVMGKMIQVLGVGFDYENRIDLDEYWDGWLPMKSINILREI